MSELTDEQLRAIYSWIDAIPLSRPKKNMARDFNDGVMLAEVVAAYFPQLVELHNYPPANSLKQKVYNFETLNQRVLKKLGYTIPKPVIEDIANSKPGSIEKVLNTVQIMMAKYRERKASAAGSGESVSSGQGNRNGGYDDDRGPRGAPGRNGQKGGHGGKDVGAMVDEEILLEKEQQIRELQETVEILELKVAKLEQLVRLKDNKIQKLLNGNK